MTEPRPTFRIERTASDEHIDDLNHVANTVYVSWVIEVAAAHSAAVGWTFDAYRASGGVFVVRRHEIDYLIPAVAGDRIALETWIERWKAASSLRCTAIRRARDGAVLARARTLWAFVDLASGRPRRIPETLRDAFEPPAS